MRDLLGNILGFVIDNGIETGFFHEPLAFLFASGNADHAAAFQLGNLADDRTGGTGRTRNKNGVARLRHADIHQAEISRHAGNTQN